jgi:hypothetical protein
VWLNKEYITMYSSIGLGFKYEKSKYNNKLNNYSDNYWRYNMAGDIAPIGINCRKISLWLLRIWFWSSWSN